MGLLELVPRLVGVIRLSTSTGAILGGVDAGLFRPKNGSTLSREISNAFFPQRHLKEGAACE